MRRGATWAWRILAGLAGLVLVLVVWSALLPERHSASVSGLYTTTPADLWSLLAAADDFPRWRPDVERVEVTERGDDGSPLAWTEHSSHGPLPLRIAKRSRPYLLVTRIDSEELGFAGTWTYRIEELSASRVRLTISEDGEDSNLVFRFLSRYLLGYERTLRDYHAHLERELGS